MSIGCLVPCCLQFAACGWVSQRDAGDAGLSVPCPAAPGTQQRLRDDLASALAYLKASKDNFGAGRGRAIELVSGAVDELVRASGGAALVPSEGAETVAFAGAHDHPRMTRAWQLLQDARYEAAGAACFIPGPVAELRRRIDLAIDAVEGAFVYNPPGSRH